MMTRTKNLSAVIFATSFVLALTACGSKSMIDLRSPPAAPAPEAPKSSKPLPGNPANPNDPASNPEKPDQPAQTGPVQARYRLICDRQTTLNQEVSSPFSFLDTTTKSFEGAYIVFLGTYADPNQVVTRDNQNIHKAINAVPIPGAQGDAVDFLFVAAKDTAGGHLGSPRLYQVHADTLMRTGNAVDVGAPPSFSSAALQAAEAAGFKPANYGASDEGNFVLLPTAGGFRVMSHDRRKTFGLINANSSSTILPKIFESKKMFTALVYSGGRFSIVAKKLSFTSSSVSVSQTLSVGGSGSATAAQTYDNGSLIWSESTKAPAGAASLTFAKLDVASGRVTRSTYASQTPNAKVYPQFAVINENGARVINIAVESLRVVPPQGDSTSSTVRVDYARIEKLSLDGGSLKQVDAIDYPAQATTRVEASGLRAGSTIVKTLFTTENQDELLGTFDSYNGYQIYKDRGGYMDGVSQNNCYHPQVVEELL